MIHVSATKAPFASDETHLTEAILFDDTALTETNAITLPRGVAITRKAKRPAKYQVKIILLPGGKKAYHL